MKIDVSTKIGDVLFNFHIDEQKEMEALHKAAVLGSAPRYCGLCDNDASFRLVSNKDKEGNTYVDVLCLRCGAKAKLGQYKVGGYFWHEFKKYQKGEE